MPFVKGSWYLTLHTIQAKFHYLVIPKDVQLNSARELTKLHLNLLKEMQQKSELLIKDLHSKAEFKYIFWILCSWSICTISFIIIHKELVFMLNQAWITCIYMLSVQILCLVAWRPKSIGIHLTLSISYLFQVWLFKYLLN